MSDRPTSIEGGIVYDRAPAGGSPITQRYLVAWVTVGGGRRGVKGPTGWVGVAMPPYVAAVFRRAVERDMAAYPPV